MSISTNGRDQLLGIELLVAHPQQYVLSLREALLQHYPDWAQPLEAINAFVTSEAAQPASELQLGWFKPAHLTPLLQREWLNAPSNEFEELGSYLATRPVFHPTESVLLCGAGVGRLAEWLSRQPCGEIVCADLSWVALYCGRLMMEGRSELLPAALNAELIHYENDTVALRSVSRKPAWLESTARKAVVYRVEDAFRLSEPLPATTLCLPYLLDALANPITLLLKMLLGLKLGRSVVIIVSLTSTRNPDVLLAALGVAGFSIEFVEIARLPYSFSRHNFTYKRETLPTMVLRATKTSGAQLSRVAVAGVEPAQATFDFETQTFSVQRPGAEALGLGEDLFACYRTCREGGDFAKVSGRIGTLVGEDNIDLVVGHLTSHGLISLTPTQ